MKKVLLTVILLAGSGTGRLGSEIQDGSRGANQAAFVGEIQQRLLREGFENVVVGLREMPEKELIIEYENRKYRYELRAMGVLCALVASKDQPMDWLTLIPKNRDVPLVRISLRLQDYRAFISDEISAKDFARTLVISHDPVSYAPDLLYQTPPANHSFRKIDLFIKPGINARLGNYDDPYKIQLNIVPEVVTFLCSGLQLSAEFIIPLENELGEEGEDARPGKIVLDQTLRLAYNNFCSFKVGYFDPNRYGFSVAYLKFWLNGSLSFSAKADYTGFLIYLNKRWYYSDLNKWTWLLTGAYQFSALDFSLRLSRGTFLMGDRGWRVDMLRSMGEIDIGLFAIKTNAETIGGLNLHLPIFPSRRCCPSRLRASPPFYFDWSYRYRVSDYGTDISTTCDLRDFMKKLMPSFIRNNVEEFKLR